MLVLILIGFAERNFWINLLEHRNNIEAIFIASSICFEYNKVLLIHVWNYL